MSTNLPYLLLSVSLSSGRNIISKRISSAAGNLSRFFLSQSILFASAALLLFLLSAIPLRGISSSTLIYAAIYGLLLILSQWFFTLALRNGNTSVCSVIYSFGFILPTLSGALFWKEPLFITHVIGILIAIAVILLSAKKGHRERQIGRSFIPFILIAMLGSGGLGIMQKVQQNSSVAGEKGAFLTVAFTLAFLGSLFACLLCHETVKPMRTEYFFSVLAGSCFGGANFCNTVLAGKMKSAVFFPVQNISTILLSTLLGIILFHERLTLRHVSIILLAILGVLFFSL